MAIDYVDIQALALESANDCTYNEDTGTYILTANDMVQYVKIIAYKTAAALRNGHLLNPTEDPLIYMDCDDCPPLTSEDFEDDDYPLGEDFA